MLVEPKEYSVKGLAYTLRSARPEDAGALARLKARIDGETEFLDREPGEGRLTPGEFAEVVEKDTAAPNHLFLLAEVNGVPVGLARCEGGGLKRFRHQAEFGVCVLQQYWGYGIGKHLLARILEWADETGLVKVTLKVLADNKKAIALYERHGFETEGILKKDKLLSDGFHDTVVMGRFGPNL